jgi:hypothetical protein
VVVEAPPVPAVAGVLAAFPALSAGGVAWLNPATGSASTLASAKLIPFIKNDSIVSEPGYSNKILYALHE